MLSEIGALTAIAGALAKTVNPGGSTPPAPSGGPTPPQAPQGGEAADNHQPLFHVTVTETGGLGDGGSFGFSIAFTFTISVTQGQIQPIPIQLQISPPPPPTVDRPDRLRRHLEQGHVHRHARCRFFQFRLHPQLAAIG
ncbi:MAG: hypothetical protein WDO24_12155 [Pseudomonadota bacterium]